MLDASVPPLVDHFQLVGNLHLPAACFHRAHNPLVTDNRRVTNLDRNPFSDLIASLQIDRDSHVPA